MRRKTFLLNKDSILKVLEKNTYKNPTTSCWEFLGARVREHGVVTIESQQYYVHRLSMYIFKNFDLDSKIQINHKPIVCKKAICWNPDHLYEGNQCENINDIYTNFKRTHCKNGHELTSKNSMIRQDGNSKRCKICTTIRMKKWYLENKARKPK